MGLILGGIITIAVTAHAERVTYIAPEEVWEPKEVLIEVRTEWTAERIENEIDLQAEQYGVSAEVMRGVIRCESNGSTTIQSRHGRHDDSTVSYGDPTREQSFGLVQINLPAHKDVTYEQAIDPGFAVKFLAKNLKRNPGMWTCYRKLYL